MSFAEHNFKIEDYFAGRTYAWGMFQDRFGKLRRSFDARMDGEWQGEEFVLNEDFRYHDGEVVSRVWRFRPKGDGLYQATANDIDGLAEGRIEDDVLYLRYKLLVPIQGKTWALDFDDRMFLLPEGIVMNRARASKFGITVGSVTASFSKIAPAQALEAANSNAFEQAAE